MERQWRNGSKEWEGGARDRGAVTLNVNHSLEKLNKNVGENEFCSYDNVGGSCQPNACRDSVCINGDEHTTCSSCLCRSPRNIRVAQRNCKELAAGALSFASWSARPRREEAKKKTNLGSLHFIQIQIFEFRGCRAPIATISLSAFQRMTTPTNTTPFSERQ